MAFGSIEIMYDEFWKQIDEIGAGYIKRTWQVFKSVGKRLVYNFWMKR